MEKTIKYLENGEYHYATVRSVGDLAQLKTNSKETLVEAINELWNGGGNADPSKAPKPEGYDQLVQDVADAVKNQQEINQQWTEWQKEDAQLTEERKQAYLQAMKEMQESIDKAKADAAALDKKLQEGVDTLNNKTSKLDEEITKTFSDLDTSIQNMHEQLQKEADRMNKDLQDTKGTLSTLRTDLQNTQMDNGRIHDELTNINGKFEHKVWQTDLDPLKEQIERAETSVQQTKDELLGKASRQDLDTVSNTVSKLDTQLKETAKGVEISVKKDELGGEIAEALINKTNILLGTRRFTTNNWTQRDHVEMCSDPWKGFLVAKQNSPIEGIQQAYDVKAGTTYTFSLFAKMDNLDDSNKSQITLAQNNFDTSLDTKIDVWRKDIDDITSDFKRYDLTFTPSEDCTIYPHVISNSNNPIFVCGYQLEIGKELTPWEPNQEDVGDYVEKSEAQFNVYNDKIQALTEKQRQQGDTQEQLRTEVTQTAEGVKQVSESLKNTNGDITKLRGDLERTADHMKSEYETYTNKAVGQISDSTLNLIRNSSFQNKDEDFAQWQNISTKANIRQDENGLRWVELTQSGLTTNNPQGITSNYFVIKQGKVTVAVDIKLGDKATLDNQNILLLELYNDNKQRVDFTDVSVSQLGLSTAILNDHNVHRGLYRLGIDREDVKYMTVKAILHRNGDLLFTNFSARLSSIDDGGYTPNPDDVNQQILKQNTKIEQDAKQIALKANSVDVTRDIKSAVDGIQVGGRNLLLGTSTDEKSGKSYDFAGYQIAGGLKPNTTYTLSGWARVDQKAMDNKQNVFVCAYTNDWSWSQWFNISSSLTAKYSKVTFTTPTGNNFAPYVTVYLQHPNNDPSKDSISGQGFISRLKLEEGNKATSWTPSPEDTSEEIKSAKDAAIKVSSDQIDLHVNELRTSFDDKLNEQINEAKSASQKFTSDGIEQTVKKITDVKNGVDRLGDKVNNIQVGGRNLLRNSDKDISITSHTTDGWPAWANIDTGYSFEHGKTYTFSTEARNSTDKITEASIRVFEFSTNTQVGIYAFPADGKRHSVTFTVPNDSHDYHLLLYAGHAGIVPGVNVTTTYHHPKLEEGNVATDWTPAPEDVDSKFQYKEVTGVIDFNDLKTQQKIFYKDTQAKNSPAGGTYWYFVDVDVEPGSARIIQTATSDRNNITWKRTFADTWTAWQKQASQGDVDTASDGLRQEIKSAKEAAIKVSSDQINLHVNEITSSFDDKLNKRVNEVKTASEKFTSDGIEQTVTKITNVKNDVDRLGDKVDSFGGGINLVKETSELEVSGKSYDIKDYNFAEPLEPNTKYTISVEAKVDQTALNHKQFVFIDPYTNGWSWSVQMNCTPANLNYQYYRYTFTTPDASKKVTNISVYLAHPDGANGGDKDNISGIGYFRKLKVEKGEVATPWTPYSQDINKKIDTQTFDSANIDEMRTQGHYFVKNLTGNPVGGWVYVDVTGNNNDRIRQDVYQDSGSKHMYRRWFGTYWTGWEQGAYLSDVNNVKTEVTASVKNLGDRVTTEVNSITTRQNNFENETKAQHSNDVELVRKSDFEDGSKGNWTVTGVVPATNPAPPAELGQSGMKVLQTNTRDGYEDGIWYSVKPGEKFDVDFWCAPSPAFHTTFGLCFVDKNKGNWNWQGIQTDQSGQWKHYTGTIAAPTNAAFARPWYQMEKPANNTENSSWIAKPHIRRQNPATIEAIREVNTKWDVANGQIQGKVTATDVNNILNGKGYATQSWAQTMFTMKSDAITLQAVRDNITNGIQNQVNSTNDRINDTNNRLNNLKIGGTNLLRGTSDTPRRLQGSGYLCKTTASDIYTSTADFHAGDQFTYSATITNNSNHPVSLEMWLFNGREKGQTTSNINSHSEIVPAHTQNRRVSATITITSDTWWVRTYVVYSDGHGVDGETVDVSNEKLEVGNVATDWSPNPNDTGNGVNVLRGTADFSWPTGIGTNGTVNLGYEKFDATTIQLHVWGNNGGIYTKWGEAFPDGQIQVGEQYVFSFDIKGNGTFSSVKNESESLNIASGVPVTNTYQRVKVVGTIKSLDKAFIIYFQGDYDVRIKNVKIERGSKATPWTPHPFDDKDKGVNLLKSTAYWNPSDWNHISDNVWYDDNWTDNLGHKAYGHHTAWQGLGQTVYVTPGVYTWSAQIYLNGLDSNDSVYPYMGDGQYNGTAQVQDIRKPMLGVNDQNRWIDYSTTFYVTNAGNLCVRPELNRDHGTIHVGSQKLEHGMVATPWSPSPLDDKNATITLDSADINSMKTQGHYFVRNLANSPIAGWVYVDVTGNNNDRLKQEVYQDNGYEHRSRRWTGSGWTEWTTDVNNKNVISQINITPDQIKIASNKIVIDGNTDIHGDLRTDRVRLVGKHGAIDMTGDVGIKLTNDDGSSMLLGRSNIDLMYKNDFRMNIDSSLMTIYQRNQFTTQKNPIAILNIGSSWNHSNNKVRGADIRYNPGNVNDEQLHGADYLSLSYNKPNLSATEANIHPQITLAYQDLNFDSTHRMWKKGVNINDDLTLGNFQRINVGVNDKNNEDGKWTNDPLMISRGQWNKSSQADRYQPTIRLGYDKDNMGSAGVTFLWNQVKPFGNRDISDLGDIWFNGQRFVFGWASHANMFGNQQQPAFMRLDDKGGIMSGIAFTPGSTWDLGSGAWNISLAMMALKDRGII